MKLKRMFIAAALVTLGVGAALNHASATTTSGNCVTVPDPYSGSNYQMQQYFSVSYTRSGSSATATVKRVGNTPLCKDQPMVVQSFNMGANWNGEPDGHSSFISSLPQTIAYATHFTFGKDETSKTVTVKAPEACKGTQLDTYVGDKEISKIAAEHEGETREITGKIFQPTETCEVPKVDVCNPTTGEIISVPETDEDKYAPKDSDKCVKMQVCVKDSGVTTMQTITKDKFDSSKYSTNADDCAKPVTPVTPTPVAPISTPLPSTGPEEIIGGLAGSSALTYGAYTYVASRRAVRNAHRQ